MSKSPHAADYGISIKDANSMRWSSAINKPKFITSAQVVRDLQEAFNPSKLFAPWLAAEKAARDSLSPNQKRRRRDKRLNVKIGHGGTLDPLATGVLIIGVGKGTKKLQGFLECTKAYEATLLFGAATDTYDVLGKVLSKAPYSQVTKHKVEEALGAFRGRIMQRPPIFSALRIQGKRLYEYAREGKEVPAEIQERPVTVKDLEITKWLEPGTHNYRWPSIEAEKEDQAVAKKLLHLEDVALEAKDKMTSVDEVGCADSATMIGAAKISDPQADFTMTSSPDTSNGVKRKLADEDQEDDDLVFDARPPSKRREVNEEFLMSGALQSPAPEKISYSESQPHSLSDQPITSTRPPSSEGGPPAVKIRMTVTSGFYVRSLCHDLGEAVGSLGIMSELVRTRQAEFELGKNVLDYEDLGKGEDVWGSKVEGMLGNWKEQAERRAAGEDSAVP